MLLTKQFLNELNQKGLITESLKFSRKEEDEYDVFISYSSHDIEYAKKVVGLLKECGYSAYADYQDVKLNRNNVNKLTAQRLASVMKKCKGLLYLYSKSSSTSKWCPWGIGLFSGMKNFRCANLPIVETDNDKYTSQEYLNLFPYVDYEKVNNSNKSDFWINDENGNYVSLKHWVNGMQIELFLKLEILLLKIVMKSEF